EFAVNEAQDGLSRAVFQGDVQVESGGERPSRINAGRVQLDFSHRNEISKVRADENVKLLETTAQQNATAQGASSQQVEIGAPAIDFYVTNGKRLDHAEPSGSGRVTILPSSPKDATTVITAGNFQAKFDAQGRMSGVHGAPEAKALTRTPGQPDRTS